MIATLNSIPNPALVVATSEKDRSSVQDVLALLNNIPKQYQYPGLGNTMRFASVQSTPYTYWVKQMSQSGLFTENACPRVEAAKKKSEEKAEEKVEVKDESSPDQQDESMPSEYSQGDELSSQDDAAND